MNSIVYESLQILLIGMAVVGLFLLILVFVMMLISKIVTIIDKYIPVVEEETISTSSVTKEVLDNKNLALAIAIAYLKTK